MHAVKPVWALTLPEFMQLLVSSYALAVVEAFLDWTGRSEETESELRGDRNAEKLWETWSKDGRPAIHWSWGERAAS